MAGSKQMNKLDHVVTDNIKTSKDKHDEAIYNESTFGIIIFNSSRDTRDLLPVVTVTLLGGKKHRATNVASLKCLYDSGSTNIMINIKHTKYYEHKMRSNKGEYITAAGLYCTTHDVKVPFSCRIFPEAR